LLFSAVAFQRSCFSAQLLFSAVAFLSAPLVFVSAARRLLSTVANYFTSLHVVTSQEVELIISHCASPRRTAASLIRCQDDIQISSLKNFTGVWSFSSIEGRLSQ
jgi:hypothetical protein